MRFWKISAGHYRAFSPAHDEVHIRKEGRSWKLEIVEYPTGGILHSFSASKQYLCAQEANRFYGHGAYARQDP